jgi:hypothetical protein
VFNHKLKEEKLREKKKTKMYSSSKYSDFMDNQSSISNHYYSTTSNNKTIYIQEPIYTTTQPQNVPLIIIDPPTHPQVNSYIIWSIVNLLCCGFITGLVTTILSIRVIALKDKRLFKEASSLSDKIMLLNFIITILGAVIYIVAFPYFYVAIYPSLPKINY